MSELLAQLTSLETNIAALLSHWRRTFADSLSAEWTETEQGEDMVLDALAEMAEQGQVSGPPYDSG